MQYLNEIEPPIIIFVNQKKGADVLARSLEKMGVSDMAECNEGRGGEGSGGEGRGGEGRGVVGGREVGVGEKREVPKWRGRLVG